MELFELSGVKPNPRVSSVNMGADICRQEQIDVLLAVGGGSTIDATKCIGAATYYDGDAWDLVTRKTPITDCLPIVSVLTLAATGSEMNGTAVISNMETNDKIGIGNPLMRPKVSFLDPTNTFTVNSFQTASGAADIISHILEVYFSMDHDLYMLDRVMEGMIRTVIKYAPIALQANLMWAPSWAINGFINGGKQQAWSCHAMEHQLSAFYDITHGLGLAILTTRWMQHVLDETTAFKFHQFGCNVFGLDPNLEPMVVAKKSIEMLSDFFFQVLGLQSSLSQVGIDAAYIPIMAQKACKVGVISGFKPLNREDVESIYSMSP